MFAYIVGNVDFNSAIVLIVLFISICTIITTIITKHRSILEITNEFELAKIKQKDEQDRYSYVNETSRAVKFKELEQNLITSHRQDG